MSASTESIAASLTRLFRASDAMLGKVWLESVSSGWTSESLHSLVVTNGTISAAKTREIYGHFRTKTQMKSIPSPYSPLAPVPLVKKEMVRLNLTDLDVEERLNQLRTEKVGGMLLVTTVMNEDGTSSQPFLTCVAAPSMATFAPPLKENGVLYEDIWEKQVLERFFPALDPAVAHCPLMGAQQGFSRAASLKPGMFQLLQDAQPLFFPAGELLCADVTFEGDDYPRAILLPEVCNLPVGMRWPVDIRFKDFYLSIQGAMGPAGQVFQQMLLSMETTLAEWFEAIDDHTVGFSVPSCPFLPFYDQHYPALDTGEWPSSVADREGFSPLMDMVNGHLWRLWCERMLTTESKWNRQHLNAYLLIGEKACLAETYLGATIPGRFCPNFAHHFKVTNGWPTDTAKSKFLREFQHLPLISHQAQQYDPMEVDLHQPHLELLPFKTREERMSEDHRNKTPRFTEVVPATPTRTKAVEKPPSTALVVPQVAQPFHLEIPDTVRKFSPSPTQLRRLTPMGSAPALPRRLEDELSAMSNPTSTSGGIFNPLTGTVYTAEGRGCATEIFLNVCRLLAHHSTRRALLVGKEPLPPDALIYVREPCGLFRREVLSHAPRLTATSGFMPSFLSFVEAVLRPAQIHLAGVYDPQFFTGGFLHTLLTVDAWMVSDMMLPAAVPNATFHVYRMISSLQAHAGHPLLLPSTGLTLLEAKQVGILTYHLFAMMDLVDGTFSDEKFVGSILGNRLKIWSTLPDSAMIHGLWTRAPLQATYYWLASLQSLLQIVMSWVKRLKFHPEKGFFHARDREGKRYLLLDNQVPSNIPGRTDSLTEALRHYDTSFETRWFCGSFLDSIWTNPIPPGHSVVAPSLALPPTLTHGELVLAARS
jgi:hypothetical protein